MGRRERSELTFEPSSAGSRATPSLLPTDIPGDELVPLPEHLADDSPVDEPEDPIGLLGHIHVVGDQDEGLVHLPVELS